MRIPASRNYTVIRHTILSWEVPSCARTRRPKERYLHSSCVYHANIEQYLYHKYIVRKAGNYPVLLFPMPVSPNRSMTLPYYSLDPHKSYFSRFLPHVYGSLSPRNTAHKQEYPASAAYRFSHLLPEFRLLKAFPHRHPLSNL